MTETFRSLESLASTVSFAQSRGKVVYNTKCKMYRGATDTSTAKFLNVKPVSDLAVRSGDSS
jgi:hypothetical protein